MNIPQNVALARAIKALRPNAEFSFQGTDLSTLEVYSSGWEPISEVEVAEEILAQEAAAEDNKLAYAAATTAAIAHAKSLGFTDAMIAVMYPNLGSAA